MITLVNGKGEQINGFQFLDWDEAESYLSEQRKKGMSELYLRGDFGTPIAYNGVYFIVVGFADDYSMVKKPPIFRVLTRSWTGLSRIWISSDIPIFSSIT